MKSVLLRLHSIWAVLIINFRRFADHGWRQTTGMPLLRKNAITPELFLGGQYSRRGLRKMHDFGIRAIVNMRENLPFPQEVYEKLDILHLPTADLQASTVEQLREGIEFIGTHVKQGQKVYIHCRWGEGRGPSMVLAYLISTGMTLDDALSLVQSVRPFARPTRVQIERLREVEEMYMNS